MANLTALAEALRFLIYPSPEMRRLAKATSRYDSIFDIRFDMFFTEKHLITDWDGVWVPQGGALDSRARGKLEEAVASYKSVSVLSNCGTAQEYALKELLTPIGVNFFRAQPKKPDPRAFYSVFEALELLADEVRSNVVYIGDRFYSDIYGANRAGIGTVVMVSPLPANEPLLIRMVRMLERLHFQSGNL